ncbi:MAG: hypothetical protein ACJA1A_001799 [Saprospiraceae bacterium]|jgi:hypothetical protein
MDIRRIIRLKLKGWSQRKIGDQIGAHRNKVNEYVRLFNSGSRSYDELLALTDQELSLLFTRTNTVLIFSNMDFPFFFSHSLG